MLHQSLIDLGGPYLVGAFWFSPILRIGPIPTRATPGLTEAGRQSLMLKAIRPPHDP